MKNKSEFLRDNLDLKGWKATSIDLKENALFIELRNRKKEISRLIFLGVIAFRDEGVIGKSPSALSLSNQGSYKRVFLRNAAQEILFFIDCMEAMFEGPKPKGK